MAVSGSQRLFCFNFVI